MQFIFGGAHQGMMEHAFELTGEREIAVLDEDTLEIDFSAPAVAGLEKFVLGCVRRGESAQGYFEAHEALWQNCVLIGMDFSCGVVPMDPQLRLWRDENGRLNNYLAGRAKRVVRMFCGLAQVIK